MKAKVSEKGQVTIPKRLRERLGIQAGDVLEFSEEHGRLIGTKHMARSPVDSVYGILAGIDAFPEFETTDAFVEAIRGAPDAIEYP